MNQRANGIVYIKIRDELFRAVDDFTYNLGFYKKESIDGGLSGNAGFTVKYQPAFVECTLALFGDQLSKVIEAENVQVTVEFRNGRIATFDKCFFEGEGTFDAITGKLKCKFVSTSDEPATVTELSI